MSDDDNEIPVEEVVAECKEEVPENRLVLDLPPAGVCVVVIPRSDYGGILIRMCQYMPQGAPKEMEEVGLTLEMIGRGILNLVMNDLEYVYAAGKETIKDPALIAQGK